MEAMLRQVVQSTISNQEAAVVIGEIFAMDGDGSPLVDIPESSEEPQVALVAGSLTKSRLQHAMECGYPVLMLQSPVGLVIIDTVLPYPEADRLPGSANGAQSQSESLVSLNEKNTHEVVIKGDTVRIEASQSITLLAKGVQVHLDARGKITTTADTIVSRARGANKVQGGSVQLN